MKFNKATWLLAPVAVIVAIAGWNYLSVQRQLSSALDADPRNEGISASAHYKWYVNPNVVVFDLRGISETNSQADVFRSLLQFAETMESSDVGKVVLAYKGDPRFTLDGAYFKTLGVEYGHQNPIYTLRTLPEHVYNLDGTRAFGTWTGGWLGVAGKQMQDLSSFAREWFLNDVAAGN